MRLQDIIADFLQRFDPAKTSPDDGALQLIDNLAREGLYLGFRDEIDDDDGDDE